MDYIGFSDVACWKDLRVGVGFIGGAGLVVQGYECCLGMAEVGGSIPSQSTKTHCFSATRVVSIEKVS